MLSSNPWFGGGGCQKPCGLARANHHLCVGTCQFHALRVKTSRIAGFSRAENGQKPRFYGENKMAPALLKNHSENALTLRIECLECANRNPITERTIMKCVFR